MRIQIQSNLDYIVPFLNNEILIQESYGGYACCPHINGVCCDANSNHCCPHDHTCTEHGVRITTIIAIRLSLSLGVEN